VGVTYQSTAARLLFLFLKAIILLPKISNILNFVPYQMWGDTRHNLPDAAVDDNVVARIHFSKRFSPTT
jgi:hypothetical protein